jgi:hypothetical protein
MWLDEDNTSANGGHSISFIKPSAISSAGYLQTSAPNTNQPKIFRSKRTKNDKQRDSKQKISKLNID